MARAAGGRAMRVEGLKDLNRKLKRLEDRTGRAALVRSAGAGAGVIRDEAGTRAPRSAGAPTRGDKHLADAIETDIEFASRNSVSINIGPAKEQFHGVIVELKHRPYLRPAFDAKGEDAVREIADVLRHEIMSVARGG